MCYLYFVLSYQENTNFIQNQIAKLYSLYVVEIEKFNKLCSKTTSSKVRVYHELGRGKRPLFPLYQKSQYHKCTDHKKYFNHAVTYSSLEGLVFLSAIYRTFIVNCTLFVQGFIYI